LSLFSLALTARQQQARPVSSMKSQHLFYQTG